MLTPERRAEIKQNLIHMDAWSCSRWVKEIVRDMAFHIDLVELERDRLITKKETLFNAIKHGDEKHQGWLKQAIEDHFNAQS